MSLILGFIDTPEGWAAARYAVSEARMRNVPIVAVNSMRGGSSEDVDDYVAINQATERLEKMLTDEGVDFQVKEYVRGLTPSEDLIAASQEFDGDLIVIGIRKRSSTGKLLLGSNALEILHDADVPVVCVKAQG